MPPTFPEIDREILSDIALTPSVRYASAWNGQQAQPRVALLTGATGFLGANLLSDLLRSTQHEIICLVRSSSAPAALADLYDILRVQGLCEKQYQSRLRVLLGDLSQPRLGLSQAAFESLAGEIGLIYHSGARINLVLPYRAMRAVNVAGTQELLRLAALAPATAFHHISSIAVFGEAAGQDAQDIVEVFRADFPAGLSSGYAKSKWAAEQLVTAAAERGLSASIYRPGMITGHTRTGICNLQDSLSLLLRTSIKLRTAPQLNGRIHMTPVDFVSRAIVQLSQMPSSSNKCFHLLNPNSISWQQICSVLYDSGYVDEIQSYDQWLYGLERSARRNSSEFLEFAHALFHDAPPFQAQEIRKIDDHNTSSALADNPELSYPSDNIELLNLYLSYLASTV